MKPTTGADVRALLQNRTTDRPRAEVPAVVVDGSTATIRLYDVIDSWGGWWGMSANELADALDDIPANVSTIELLINSPGGEVTDAAAMMNLLRARRSSAGTEIVAIVQGIAASAASVIACAADRTIMAPNSTLMIHDAWGLCVGNAEEMLAYATVLETFSADMAGVYAAKSGKTLDEVREWMRAETFFTADAAVEAGLADTVAATSTEDTANALAAIGTIPGANQAETDMQALEAQITETLQRLGIEIPSAGEREDNTTDTTTPVAEVDPEQAARLLSTITLTKETTNE